MLCLLAVFIAHASHSAALLSPLSPPMMCVRALTPWFSSSRPHPSPDSLMCFRLFLKSHSGTAGRQSSLVIHGADFSTKDMDNDNCMCKCALMLTGGKCKTKIKNKKDTHTHRKTEFLLITRHNRLTNRLRVLVWSLVQWGRAVVSHGMIEIDYKSMVYLSQYLKIQRKTSGKGAADFFFIKQWLNFEKWSTVSAKKGRRGVLAIVRLAATSVIFCLHAVSATFDLLLRLYTQAKYKATDNTWANVCHSHFHPHGLTAAEKTTLLSPLHLHNDIKTIVQKLPSLMMIWSGDNLCRLVTANSFVCCSSN